MNNNFPEGNSKLSLLNRIYDSGKGEKFNDLTNNQVKPKEYKAFLTNDDLSDVLVHLDKRSFLVTKHNTKTENFMKESQRQKDEENSKSRINKMNTNKKDDYEYSIDKNDLINNKKFDIKPKDEQNTEESRFFNPEKSEKKIQELASITGYKTISPLPPSRGRRDNSYNPMIDRFKATAGNETAFTKTNSKFAVSIYNNHMEPKLIKPATTIMNLEDSKYSKDNNFKENEAVTTKTLINYNTNIPMNTNKFEDNENLDDDKNLMTINNILTTNNDKKDVEESDQDQYMDNINKFIREAFEGKDYRINFVYYLPSNKENFYELRQATYSKICKEPVYYTLSAKGLTVYQDKIPKEFIKLSEWIIERQGYNYISQINFFKNFKIWRILKIWRKNIFKQKKIAYSNELANTLLFDNNQYNVKICKHKMYCNRLIHLSLLDLRVGMESNTYEMFLKKQESCRLKLSKEIREVHKICENIFIEGIKKIFSDVQKKINLQNNESNYNNDENMKKKNKKFNVYNKRKEKEEKEENLHEDDNMQINDDNIVGFDNYPYKYKMMIKTECKNFIKLSFLFDYILLDVLRSMYVFSMTDILKKFGEYNFFEIPEKLRENVIDKRNEYIKPPQTKNNRNIPYFLIKAKLDNKPIEKLDRRLKTVKQFYPKSSHDDEFDPTAHLILEDEKAEREKQEKLATMDPSEFSKLYSHDKEISVEVIERPNYYFTCYEPNQETLINGIIDQIKESMNALKIEGWRGHPKFKKYIQYLEDWDDRFSNWDNDSAPELDPQIILLENMYFDERDILIREQIKIAYEKCDKFLTKLNPYLQLHWKQASIKKELFLEENLRESDEMLRLLFYYLEKNVRTIHRYVPFDEELGLIKLNFEDHLRKDLVNRQFSTINYLKPLLPGILKDRLSRIEKWFSEMQVSVQGTVDNELVFLEKTKARDILESEFSSYERKLNIIDSASNFLKTKLFNISNEDIKAISIINAQKYALSLTWKELNENLQKNREKLKYTVVNFSIPEVYRKAEQIENYLCDEKFITYDPITSKSLIPSYIQELEKYENIYKNFKRDSNYYNEFLKVVEQPEVNFDKIERIYDNLTILKNLWNALKNFEMECDEWKKTKFNEIETKIIIDKIDQYFMIGKKAQSQYGENGTAILELLSNVEKYKESMNVVDDLKSDSLTATDWEKIHDCFPNLIEEGRRLDTKDYNLDFLLEIEAYKYQNKIHEIVLEAYNAKILEAKKNEIIAEKKAIAIDIINYPAKPEYLIFDKDKIAEAIQKLEECQSKVNAVLASRYVRLVKAEMQTTKAELDGSLETIEDLKTFQKKWMYLENIISSGDIKKKMPDIGEFNKTDQEWKNYLLKFKGKFYVIPSYVKMREIVLRHTTKLDEIQHSIEELLRAMRDDFERFYFISNDDLLFMLAECVSTNPDGIDKIKPYLGKIFEDINDLKINSSGGYSKEITHVISSAREELQIKGMKINDKLEDWLQQLESQMITKLIEKISQGKQAFLEVDRDGNSSTKDLEEYLLGTLSQVVATVSHAVFCEKTEAAIILQNSESSSLQIHLAKIQSDIGKYAKLVNKNFPKNVRRTISNLITHYVHYKDMCNELFIVEPYETTDFVWQKQLRSYLQDNTESNSLTSNMIVKIKQLKAEMDYGYEYIGPTVRLVITPLTDRVWLTMTSALHIKLGCSLGGPAGTGKTETTKDLAKFLGIQCIVFNCSEQVDYKLIGNIFAGLCIHKQGAFACLDEFNRINVEVLSVIASQLLNIRLGLLSPIPPPSSGAKRTVFILTSVELVGKLGIFITMNPTYSGRAELPDNLKSLFRPITMMVPDFNVIAQVKLYSEGFTKSDILAKKLTNLYSLASQQLSQQDHYDFTLRTLGSVLSIAGNLKRQNKNMENDKKEEENILIAALRDANFPKFVRDDIALFKALLSDLFPDNDLSEQQMPDFELELKQIIKDNKLDDNEFTIKKCLQIFDITNIRLGVCLTGPAGSGKSVCLSLVEKTLTSLRAKNHPDTRFKSVKKWIINPKSISMGELYGEENEDTKTFTFGVATKKIKKALKEDGETKYGWVILDGPIDTKWIENMNSVLDDSMTLCLSNGERIKLKPNVKIYFEVEDLSQASLATVSRLGIVYLDSEDLGWKPYFKSWIQRFLPDESVLNNEIKHYLVSLFDDKINEALENLEDMKSTIYIKPISVQCITSVCKFLEIYLTRENGFLGRDTPGLENPDNVSRLKKKLVSVFSLSVTWGVFGSVSNKSFHKIESFIRNKFTEIKLENNQNIMEYYYDFHKNEFMKYSEEKNYIFDKDAQFFSIFVPTIDTIRYSNLIEMMMRARNNLFIAGETGAGKTAIILNVIKKLVCAEELTTIQINFSARSSSENTQKTLESKLDRKKGKKILFGKGGKQLSVFIDDVNMPEPNEFGAHPPIELLRQYLDLGGFYDRPKLFWKSIEDTSLVVAGGPPTGGRSKLTDRFNRHFTILNIPQQSKQVMITIYESILKGFLQTNGFHDNVYKLSLEASIAAIDVFEFACENMKPIPANPHYLFNIRDVSKVFQGILMITKNVCKDADHFVKLWIHENQRIFGDRLTNEVDYKLFQDNLAAIAKNKFKIPNLNTDDIIKNQTVLFGEIQKGDNPERPYDEIRDVKDLNKKLNFFLEMYNKNNKKNMLTLVFFEYAVVHILRICRILRQPRGNMLLIGNGGSGKQTLCKFSAYIMNSQLSTFNPTRNYRINDFRKDIKDFIAQAGAYRKNVVLLLTDNNVMSDFILEDISSILNTGEIANLFDGQSEWPNLSIAVSDYLKSIGKADTQEAVYETFVNQTREFLHIFFCTSPVGDTFRLRIRKFPSLINCSTLDWFTKWPKEALVSCCSRLYSQLTQYPENVRDSLIRMSVQAHLDIEALTEKYFTELSRRVYITPKSFLDMNSLLFELVSKKKGDVDSSIKRLSDGIKKLEKTHTDIIKVEEDLRILEPEIKKKEEEANIAKIANLKKQEEVNASAAIVYEKQSHAMKMNVSIEAQVQRIKREKEEMDLELSEVVKEVLKEVNANFVSNVRASKPTVEERRLILEAAVLILTGNKVSAANDLTNQIGKNKDKIINFREFIDKGEISDNTFLEFKKYIEVLIPPLFQNVTNGDTLLEKIQNKTSSIYKTLFWWGQAFVTYYELEKKLQPIRKIIDEKTKELKTLERECALMKEELDKLQADLFKLNSEQEELMKKIDHLKKEIDLNNRRKINAGKLVGLLGDEGERWKQQLISLTENSQNFLGNIFVSAMSVAYLGPFTGVYRKPQISSWIYMSTNEYNLKVNKDYSLENILSDPVEIRNWNISGLPSDSVSTQNGIIFFTNPKYPLLIDPQMQGNLWIKKLLKKNNLNTYKGEVKDDQFKKQMEKIALDIMRGFPVLVENIGEKIDASFNNLISKAYFDSGNGFSIDFNGNLIEFNKNFSIFFTTKLSNPHFSPEIFLKMNIINFTVTFEGLCEQLLGEVFKKERREKYEERDKLIEEMGQNNAKLQEYGKIILQKLAEANEEAILDDEVLIETLENAKTSSDIVKVKTSENAIIEKEINNIRDEYIPVSTRGSILYLVIVDLGIIDSMYQFSLDYFKKIFSQSIEKAPLSDNVKERVEILERKITEDIYKNIKRGIFESHKTIFSYLIAVYIKKVANVITDDEWNFFLKGPSAFDKTDLLENPDKNYFSDVSWDSILYLEKKLNVRNLSRYIKDDLLKYQVFYENVSEYSDFKNMPHYDNLKQYFHTNFNFLNLVKIFRGDKVLYFVKKYISLEIGEFFIDNSPPKIEDLYAESDHQTPIIFILSQGADPTNTLIEFNRKFIIGQNDEGKPIVPEMEIISLGQGQGDKAKDGILEARKNGKWIVLANCHLYTTWMGELSNIVQMIQEDEGELETNENFRLWLTSMPNKDFPVSILQNSLKLTTEPPSGIKGNIKKLFDEINEEKLNQCNKKDKFPKIVFSLSVFHAVLQERKKYGPIGFNIRYDFNLADFETSMKLISVYLDEADEEFIPWSTIIYLIGEINYGGRVTDNFDRDTMTKTLEKFLNEDKLFEPDFKFSKSGKYYPPSFNTIQQYNEYIDSLPIFDEPDLFGLNENANIIYQIQESEKIINSLLLVMPKTKTKETSPNKTVLEMIENFFINKPELIHKRDGKHKSHDKIYDNGLVHSLTIVLYQEIEKFNKIINKIFSSLEDLKKAIEGTIVMSSEGDEIFNSLLINRIPLSWSKICYPSHKPLSSWFDDLLQRIEFMRNWLTNGHPTSFWMSGLFYPQGFITGVLQNHARDTKIPVSEITFKHTLMNKEHHEITKGPQAGVYIYGLFLEGGSWDMENRVLVDQKPGEMYFKMPVIWLETIKENSESKNDEDDDDNDNDNENEFENKYSSFSCPIFKTTKRTGIISSSGRSENYVISVNLPTMENKDIWTLRGAALICQLNN